jgi:DNA-binding winged helix-turn-helix (wHTH) protein
MIRATAITGTRDEVLEAVWSMRKAGVHQVVVQAVTDVRKTLETFSREIIRKFRR